jgi:DNA 3'-phosphatase
LIVFITSGLQVVRTDWLSESFQQGSALPTDQFRIVMPAASGSAEGEEGGPSSKRRAGPAGGGAGPSGEGAASSEGPVWESLGEGGTCLHYKPWGCRPSSRIAAFDMDDTLIRTSSGRWWCEPSTAVPARPLDRVMGTPGKKYPESEFDWTWKHNGAVNKLQALHEEGYKVRATTLVRPSWSWRDDVMAVQVVILSNQKGVSLKKQDPEGLKRKVEDIVAKSGVPMEAFLATHDDIYRKPRTGMWDALVDRSAPRQLLPKRGTLSRKAPPALCPSSLKPTEVDLGASFYVGDAAGRPKEGQRPKDHSAGDVKLAVNAGIAFKTDEVRSPPTPSPVGSCQCRVDTSVPCRSSSSAPPSGGMTAPRSALPWSGPRSWTTWTCRRRKSPPPPRRRCRRRSSLSARRPRARAPTAPPICRSMSA